MRYNRLLLLVAFVAVGLCGCVDRLITVTSKPAGAIVRLNGQEAGATPLTVPFTWYGTYEVVLRKEGYETIRTARKAEAPFYQLPVADLFFECLWPFELTDHHRWEFDLAAEEPTDPVGLAGRATEFRSDALRGD